MKKISKENDNLRKENKKFNKSINMFKERLLKIENNKLCVQSYHCGYCNFESGYRDKIIGQMTGNYDEVDKECFFTFRNISCLSLGRLNI